LVTDEKGVAIGGWKYYPFGLEAEGWGGQAGRTKFAGHERDEGVGFDYMLARYYSGGLARFVSADPAARFRENLTKPQRWNRYAYALNNPLKYFDLDGLDVTVAAIARQDVLYAYQSSATFRGQFDAAKNNPDIKLTLTRVPTVPEGKKAISDIRTKPIQVTVEASGNLKVTGVAVRGTAKVPQSEDGKPVLGVEAAARFGHELAHVNNVATGVEQTGTTTAEAEREAETAADAVERKIREDLEDPQDDISKEEAAKALAGTEPKEEKKEKK